MEDDEIIVECKLPKGWWKHPVFDFQVECPAPYIWFGYWLITWGNPEFDTPWFRIGKWSIPKISISFFPD